MKRILITGITGLIGKEVLKKLLDAEIELQITALIRPGTDPARYTQFKEKLAFEELDLTDLKGIATHLEENSYDQILHIGAVRGGRRFDRETYYKANVGSTEQMVEACRKTGTELVFCSSVGVFGAIPDEHPANNETERNPDNYYHYTKIQAERLINRAIMHGLKAAILRPSITYGKGDMGFPFQMIKMVDKQIFPLINKRVWIHLCNIDTISQAFLWLVQNPHPNALNLNVADKEPVQLNDLINFISRQLRKRNYSRLMVFDRKLFALGEFLAKKLGNELWTSRFQLISKSWFYDVRDVYQLMDIPAHFTIPEIQITIEDYLER